jgi:hypothetical protein
MEKQERDNDHFNVTEFLEEQMKEERTGVKKEETKIIEEGGYNLEDNIRIYIENKQRDEVIESCKKAYKEQKLS